MGLSSAHRLKNHRDYRAVYEQGIRRYSPHLTLVALYDDGNGKQEVNYQSEITGRSRSIQAADAGESNDLLSQTQKAGSPSALTRQRGGHGRRIAFAPQDVVESRVFSKARLRPLRACSCPSSLHVLPITPTKIGISIGKKVSKKAVVRNRIKRQIKSAITSNLRTMAPGWKIVIVVRPEAIKCKYEHFLRELEELLKQAKIINGY